MSYKQEVIINARPEKVFDAIAKDVQKWWGFTNSPVNKVGDEFTTRFSPTYWKFRISEFLPGEKISWECIDATHVHRGYENIEKEWVGTVASWELKSENEQTKVNFSHNGLTTELNCKFANPPGTCLSLTALKTM